MPDAHQGYGFAIGGVAVSDIEKGVVSAGGVGFDINCGVRLLASNILLDEIKPKLDALLINYFAIFHAELVNLESLICHSNNLMKY
jgi:tRNA-splicing ligase RtcB